MKLKLIPLILGLGLTTSLSAATERMCFGQVPIEASTNSIAKITIAENDFFATDKCKRFFPYYEKHVDFTQAECEANKGQLSLDKGYAPFGVFLRGTDSTGKDNIASYDWEIKSIATNEVLTTYNAFNASYVFDEPGEYSATLTITDKDGAQSTDTKIVTVWARDGKDYFVDSVIGDDRYNGLDQIPDNTCDANTATIGSCAGPWKTATRALGEFSPYKVENYPEGKYTVSEICAQKEFVDIIRYKQGNFKTFRSSSFLASETKKDSEGNPLPAVKTEICTAKVQSRSTKLRPGDQILFNRNQHFDMESGVNTLRLYQATHDGVKLNYEVLKIDAVANIWHWSKALGVHISAYGQGNNPTIKNTGKSSSTFLKMGGAGIFNFSITNLNFDLLSNIPNPLRDRAIFVNIPGSNPINTVFKEVNVKYMYQGILAQTSNDKTKNAQGLFIFNSHFYDSSATQLFTSNSYNNVALVNNNFDYSANHLIYSSIAHGLIYNNQLSRPAFGRTAYRLAGGSYNNPNHNVWISDNSISGWVDPRTKAETGSSAFSNGLRYNFSLVDINPNTYKEDKAIYDITFTKNKLLDAEIFLTVGAGENITISNNLFENNDDSKSSRIVLNQDRASRPLREIKIHANKFIEHSSNNPQSSSFIALSNYYQKKCTDQFNHKKISITNNTFYSQQLRRRAFSLRNLKQGQDINGVPLPNLTLDQAENFIQSEVIFDNNDLFLASESSPTIQIGGNQGSFAPDTSTNFDWSNYYESSTSYAGEYRLYTTKSLLSNTIGLNTFNTPDTITIADIIASSTLVTIDLTWDDLIIYAKENNISPSDLESMILNQVLAANPSYSGPSNNYSSDLTVFESVEQWFSSIPSSFHSLFATEESKWNDAKQLASTNNVSNGTVMISMTNK